MMDFNTMIRDPDFYILTPEDRVKALKNADPDFGLLRPEHQVQAISNYEAQFGPKAAPAIPDTMRPSHEQAGLVPAHGHQPSILPGVLPRLPGPTLSPTSPAMEAISPYYRMALEGGGSAAGTALGLAGGPVGGVVGGGMGYAGGKGVADLLDQLGGIQQPKNAVTQALDPFGELMTTGSTAEQATRPLRDLAAGVGMGALAEPAAQLVGAIPRAGRAVMDTIRGNKTIGGVQGSEITAGKVISALQSKEPIYAKNAQEARAIEDLINKGAQEGEPLFKFTTGERSFDPNVIKAQRSSVLPQGKAANLKNAADQRNAEALNNFYTRNFEGPENIDEVMGAIGTQSEALQGRQATAEAAAEKVSRPMAAQAEAEQITGARALEEIQAAKTPIKKQLNLLEKEIPDYPMKFENTFGKIDEIIENSTGSDETVAAARELKVRIARILDERGSTSKTALGLNRTMNDLAEKAYSAGDNAAGRLITQIKQEGLKADLDAMSDLARSGKITTFGGKVIDADKLASELEMNLRQIAELKSKSKPDIDQIRKGIKDAGGSTMMQVMKESDEAYAQRLAQQYTRMTGKEPPIKAGYDPKTVEALEVRNDWIKEMLNKASPGQDVGAAFRAYNQFARKEWGEKFKTGAVDTALRKGNQITGTKLRIEQIPEQFKTPQGAGDLVRAVGEDTARETMRGNLAYELFKGAPDGKVTTKHLDTFLTKRGEVLKQFGLEGEFKTIRAAQSVADEAAGAAAAFEKSVAGKLLGVDPDKAIKQVLSGGKTAGQMRELMTTLKGDESAIAGLKNAFADHVTKESQLTWKNIAGDPTTSMDKIAKSMKRSREAARVLYQSEPNKLHALQTMQRAYEITARSSRSPVATNSDTAEKIANMPSKIIDNVAGLSLKMRAAKGFVSWLNKKGQARVDEMVSRALFDPDYADFLVRGARGKIPSNQIQIEANSKIIRLDDYRKGKLQTVLTGSEAAASDND